MKRSTTTYTYTYVWRWEWLQDACHCIWMWTNLPIRSSPVGSNMLACWFTCPISRNEGTRFLDSRYRWSKNCVFYHYTCRVNVVYDVVLVSVTICSASSFIISLVLSILFTSCIGSKVTSSGLSIVFDSTEASAVLVSWRLRDNILSFVLSCRTSRCLTDFPYPSPMSYFLRCRFSWVLSSRR